jgi:endonuclease YncB( thermonuclease family)
MELASRIVSILLGLAVMVFVLWPITVPVGFGEVWWASRQAAQPPESARESSPKPAAPVGSPAQPTSPHAVLPSALPPTEPASKDENAAEPAALNETNKTGALAPNALAPQMPAPQPAVRLYHRVTVRDGGTLQSGKAVIRLAGIVAGSADATCKDAKGKTWSCGAAAKAALTRLIRGRAVSCSLPKSGEHNIFDARCSVAGTDLSIWMVRQGWADANDASLADAAKQAKADRLGLWR